MTEFDTDSPDAIARRFVQARRDGVALPDFPGVIPPTLAAAYRVQSAAIGLWPDAIAGWKVGYIAPALREPGGDERLVGPIFARRLQHAAPDRSVEAELAFRIGADAPPEQTRWTLDEAADLAVDLHIAIECAGSPLATINALGPRVVVSDFGNNAGMLLGPKIPNWRTLRAPALVCASFVDEIAVGNAVVDTLAGGPLVALAFALSRCARNGRPLRAGDLVTTGALTGIHDIVAGQSARVDFGACGSLRCRAVEARAYAQAQAAAAWV